MSACGARSAPTRETMPKFKNPLPHWNGSRVVSSGTSRTTSRTTRSAGMGAAAVPISTSPPGSTMNVTNARSMSLAGSAMRSVPATSM